MNVSSGCMLAIMMSSMQLPEHKHNNIYTYTIEIYSPPDNFCLILSKINFVIVTVIVD